MKKLSLPLIIYHYIFFLQSPQEIHGRQIYVEQAVKPRHETQNLRPPPRGGGFRGAPRGSRGGGRGAGGSRGGPRGRMGDGHMDRRLVF